MNEELIPEQVSPLEEQMNLKLVTGNVTEAIIATLRETYLPLKINGIEDKETYLLVKEGRKKCKELRVAAKKICEDGREDAVSIQKAWVAKQKEVTGRIAEVEDYLEKQEKEYEAEIAKEKESRKRKQEEQFIMRQQELSGMGALYSDGNFVLGDVSFEFSAIKESEEDIWLESIFPKFQEEYIKVEADRIEQDRIKAEKEDELKRQQEELEKKEKELAEKELRIAQEADRQAAEAKRKKEELIKSRINQLGSLGFASDGLGDYQYYEYKIAHASIVEVNDDVWIEILSSATEFVKKMEQEEAEERRKEQERQELQNKRYEELRPYNKYGADVNMATLWCLEEEMYQLTLQGKKSAFEKAEEELRKAIVEKAAREERERIEEEQRQSRKKMVEGRYESRSEILKKYTSDIPVDLGEYTEDEWMGYVTTARENHEEIVKKQEEERKAEELARASEKVKWANILEQLSAIEIPKFISGQYAKKAAILREKLEEIKAL